MLDGWMLGFGKGGDCGLWKGSFDMIYGAASVF